MLSNSDSNNNTNEFSSNRRNTMKSKNKLNKKINLSWINLLAGIIDVFLSLISFMAIPSIISQFFVSNGNPISVAVGFISFMVIGLIVHIIALIYNRKENIGIVGHILGIIGTSLYIIFGAFISIVTLILLIIACIFCFIQRKPKTKV